TPIPGGLTITSEQRGFLRHPLPHLRGLGSLREARWLRLAGCPLGQGGKTPGRAPLADCAGVLGGQELPFTGRTRDGLTDLGRAAPEVRYSRAQRANQRVARAHPLGRHVPAVGGRLESLPQPRAPGVVWSRRELRWPLGLAAHVWMAPAWQEIFGRAAQRSLA